MNAAEHVAEAERLLSLAAGRAEKRLLHGVEAPDPAIAAAQAHGILALVATLTPPARDTRPEPHSTAWCNARDSWDTAESGSRWRDLDPDMQAALAARWQARHG